MVNKFKPCICREREGEKKKQEEALYSPWFSTVDRQELIRFRQELIPLKTLPVSYSRAKVYGFTKKLFYQGFIFCMWPTKEKYFPCN